MVEWGNMALPDTPQDKTTMARLRIHLQELCDARGITRMDVVRGADLAYQTVSKWWHNKVEYIDPTVLLKLARFLDVPEAELFSIEGADDESSD